MMYFCTLLSLIKKMKKMKRLVLMIIPALICGTIVLGVSSFKGETPEQMLKEFYTQYITAFSRMSDLTNIKEKFLTEELRKRLDIAKLDYDPFLNAQDCDKAWLKNLEVKCSAIPHTNKWELHCPNVNKH